MQVTRTGSDVHGFSRFSQTQCLMKIVALYILRPLQRMPGIIASLNFLHAIHPPIDLPFRQLRPWRWRSRFQGSCCLPACHYSTSQTVDPSRLYALPSVLAPPSMIFERLELRWPGIDCRSNPKLSTRTPLFLSRTRRCVVSPKLFKELLNELDEASRDGRFAKPRRSTRNLFRLCHGSGRCQEDRVLR